MWLFINYLFFIFKLNPLLCSLSSLSFQCLNFSDERGGGLPPWCFVVTACKCNFCACLSETSWRWLKYCIIYFKFEHLHGGGFLGKTLVFFSFLNFWDGIWSSRLIIFLFSFYDVSYSPNYTNFCLELFFSLSLSLIALFFLLFLEFCISWCFYSICPKF